MDFNFTRLDLLLATPASPAAAPPAPAPGSDRAIAQLSQVLHRTLLDSPDQFRCQVTVEDGRALKLAWIAAGQTAGIGYWMSDNRVEAVTLLLSGVDLVEDLGALQVILCAVPSALPEQAVDAILQATRPLVTCLYCRAELAGDRTIATGTSALATAFFGMLGIGAENESHLL